MDQAPLFEQPEPQEPPAPPPAPTEEDAFWGPAAPATADAAAARRRPLRTWLAAGIGAAVVAAAAFAGVNLARSEGTTLAGASAPGGGPGGVGRDRFGPGGRGTNGTVATIDGTKLTVTTGAGATVTVLTSASTTFTASSTGSVADVRAGDHVTVTGTTSGTTVDALRVTDSGTLALADGPGGGPGGFGGPPPAAANGAGNAPPPANGAGPQGRADGRGGPPTAGVVKAVSSGSFTVTTADGTTLTVDTSASTVVTLVKASSLQALKVGEEIQAQGTTADDGTVTASSVRTGTFAGGAAPNGVRR